MTLNPTTYMSLAKVQVRELLRLLGSRVWPILKERYPLWHQRTTNQERIGNVGLAFSLDIINTNEISSIRPNSTKTLPLVYKIGIFPATNSRFVSSMADGSQMEELLEMMYLYWKTNYHNPTP